MSLSHTYVLWNNRVVISRDAPWAPIITAILLIAGPSCWLAWEAPYLCQAVSVAPVVLLVFFWVNALAAMFKTVLMNPGILPRDLDPVPDKEMEDQGSAFDIEGRVNYGKDRTVVLKRVDDGGDASLGTMTEIPSVWCTTCHLYRPPRSSHCRSCNMCVDCLDHHCIFLNACIGQRNYTTFYAFLLHSICTLLVGVIGCILKLYYISNPKTPAQGRPQSRPLHGFVHALKTSPESAVFFFLGIVWTIPVMSLWVYHTWLISRNRSTVEQIRLETTSRMYDVHRSTNSYFGEENACIRGCMRCGIQIRNAMVPKEFSMPIPRSLQRSSERPPRRTRGPFQHKSALRNTLQVFSRPTPVTYATVYDQTLVAAPFNGIQASFSHAPP